MKWIKLSEMVPLKAYMAKAEGSATLVKTTYHIDSANNPNLFDFLGTPVKCKCVGFHNISCMYNELTWLFGYQPIMAKIMATDQFSGYHISSQHTFDTIEERKAFITGYFEGAHDFASDSLNVRVTDENDEPI